MAKGSVLDDALASVSALAEQRLLRMPPAQAEKLLRQLEESRSDLLVPQSSPGTGTPASAPERSLSAAPHLPSDPEARRSFLHFVHYLWPGFIEGRHHAAIANAFDRIVNGTLKRLIINIAPRHGKSELTSVYLPGYYLGHKPSDKIICATHSEKLSVSFGRRVRNMLLDDEYHQIFPQTQIAKDSKAAGNWTTTMGGQYYAIGVEGKLAGRGANLLIIDDPHSEQDVVSGTSEDHFEKTLEWYFTGPRQRLQPGAAIVINQTRWGKRDLTGKLLELAKQDPDTDQWEVLNLPAILPNGEALFPEFWSLKELLALRRTLPVQRWQSQYQQNPSSEEAAVIKREWWKRWDRRAPKVEFTVSAWDTSFGEYKKGDPSANTLWGVFHPNKEPGMPKSAPAYGIILLDAFQAKLTFPDLKQKVVELYKQHRPDSLSIEAKTAGTPLIQELQRMGLPCYRDGAAHAGNDKLTRLNAVSDLFRSGLVYYLPTVFHAQEVIDQFSSFPDTEHDDLMDTGIQALERIRQGGWIELESDWSAEPEDNPDLVLARPQPPRGGWY